jgi:colicin import membrane protein
MSLPLPDYKHQVAGIVVVEVTVNQGGVVTNAIAGFRGSTIQHEGLWDAARRAALRARFDTSPDSPVSQKGTITYRFVLQ